MVVLRSRQFLTPALLALVGATALVASCSPATKDRLMHFFFEIPDEAGNETNQSQTTNDSNNHSATDRTAASTESGEYSAIEQAPEFASNGGPVIRSIHPPVAQRKCQACHNPDQRMRVRDTMIDDCRDCHQRYFSDEVGHPPVEREECLKCHDPHQTRHVALLKKETFNVCMTCHKKPERLSEEMHSRPDVQNCTACHDPHFGQGFRLKSTAPIDVAKYESKRDHKPDGKSLLTDDPAAGN